MSDSAAPANPRFRGERLLNAGAALLALLALAPLLLILATVVLVDGGGPVFYSETRLGLGGRRFRIFKFRTLRGGDGGSGLVAPAGDPRITHSGAWLRPWHLDELPQLVNILRGDMRFVGPRPVRPELWTGVAPGLRKRVLSYPPGLTSPASLQFICEDAVLAGFEQPAALYRDIIYPAKVALDVRHFENRKRWSDLKVIIATIKTLLGRRDDSVCRRRLTRMLQTRALPERRRTDDSRNTPA